MTLILLPRQAAAVHVTLILRNITTDDFAEWKITSKEKCTQSTGKIRRDADAFEQTWEVGNGGIIEFDRLPDRDLRPDQNAHAIGQTGHPLVVWVRKILLVRLAVEIRVDDRVPIAVQANRWAMVDSH